MITRSEIMKSNSVHTLTKTILKMSENKDVLDRVYDVELALKVLRHELDQYMDQYKEEIIHHEVMHMITKNKNRINGGIKL